MKLIVLQISDQMTCGSQCEAVKRTVDFTTSFPTWVNHVTLDGAVESRNKTDHIDDHERVCDSN